MSNLQERRSVGKCRRTSEQWDVSVCEQNQSTHVCESVTIKPIFCIIDVSKKVKEK